MKENKEQVEKVSEIVSLKTTDKKSSWWNSKIPTTRIIDSPSNSSVIPDTKSRFKEALRSTAGSNESLYSISDKLMDVGKGIKVVISQWEFIKD